MIKYLAIILLISFNCSAHNSGLIFDLHCKNGNIKKGDSLKKVKELCGKISNLGGGASHGRKNSRGIIDSVIYYNIYRQKIENNKVITFFFLNDELAAILND